VSGFRQRTESVSVT